jgi:hypothetical protein
MKAEEPGADLRRMSAQPLLQRSPCDQASGHYCGTILIVQLPIAFTWRW